MVPDAGPPLSWSRRRFLGAGAAAVAGLAAACGGAGSPDVSGARGIPAPTGRLITRWAADPFALGAYSYLRRGSDPRHRAALAAPIAARVYFAGEATSLDYPATVHGALLSGERAAEEVLAADVGEPVVVVGAGAAGLACAAALDLEGVDVQVIEARDRVGGRIWTETSLGAAVDLGASWIHGVEGNPLSDLAAEAGVRLVPTDYDDRTVYGADGREIRNLPDVEAALENQGDAVADFVVASEVEHEFAADAGDLSPAAADEGEEFGGDDAILREGYGELVALAAAGLDLTLSEAVTALAWDGGGVTLTTAERTIRAAAAVVTLPLGVLQAGAVRFEPGLPAAKQEAIDRLGMGRLDKLVLRFPEVFWDDTTLIGRVPERRGEWVEWLNLDRLVGEPILVGFNAGSAARRFEDLDDDAVVASALESLRAMYG